MQPPGKALIDEFAMAFAQTGRGKGMMRDEIVRYFRQYSNNVTDPAFLSRKDGVFEYCLDRLPVEDQYRALLDLCTNPPAIKNAHTLPSERQRQVLLESLHSVGTATGLTLRAVEGLAGWEVRREWLKASSRLERSPEAAITSARTLLERVCKLVLEASGSTDNKLLTDGDLVKLVRGARASVGADPGVQSISSGITSLVHGLAELSNAWG